MKILSRLAAAVLISGPFLISASALAIGLAELGLQETENGPASEQDLRFIEAAADAGLADVELAKIAAVRGVSPTVRSFAQQLAREQTGTNDRIWRLARAKGLGELSLTPSASGYGQIKRLKAASPADFDREYLQLQIANHKQLVELFRQESLKGTDGDVKNFATYALLALDDHLQTADAISRGATPKGM